jgi:thiol-disulfide isomerase/thioredoxin
MLRPSSKFNSSSWKNRLTVLLIVITVAVPRGLAQQPATGTTSAPHDTSKLTAVPTAALEANLKDLRGNSFNLSDYSGKILIVNIWATWCGPCQHEMPELMRIGDEYRDRDVVIIGGATTRNDEKIEVVRQFAKDHKVSYRLFYEDGSVARSLMEATNARSIIPQTFVITRDGRILAHFEGFGARTTPVKLREYIDLALTFDIHGRRDAVTTSLARPIPLRPTF